MDEASTVTWTDAATGLFVVDPRILADSSAVGELALCHVRLMDDGRFPWLLLLPRQAGLVEWTDLSASDLARLSGEISQAAAALKQVLPFEKLNVGALGNIVSQLHIHVIGRRTGDPAWPGPVWGQGVRVPRAAADTAALLDQLKRALALRSGNVG